MGLCTDTGRDSAALRPWKQKHSTLRQAWLICKARETGLSSLLGAKESLPLATKLPLHNKYDTMRLGGESSTRSSQEQEKDNATKLVQSTIRMRMSATEST